MEGRGEEKVGKGEVRKKEQRWEEKERGREVGDAKEVNLEGEVLLSFGESDLEKERPAPGELVHLGSHPLSLNRGLQTTLWWWWWWGSCRMCV
jgi:hypothetical protein